MVQLHKSVSDGARRRRLVSSLGRSWRHAEMVLPLNCGPYQLSLKKDVLLLSALQRIPFDRMLRRRRIKETASRAAVSRNLTPSKALENRRCSIPVCTCLGKMSTGVPSSAMRRSPQSTLSAQRSVNRPGCSSINNFEP